MKIIKTICIVSVGLLMFVFTACNGNSKVDYAEGVELTKTMIGEIEFFNGKKVAINQEDNEIIIEGEIEQMSESQQNAFGDTLIDHVVVLKIVFDKERTIDYFKISGNITKVYSTNERDEWYVGGITELLDNEAGEDAYCDLILSANTQLYNMCIRYSDGVERVYKIKIDATLVSVSN